MFYVNRENSFSVSSISGNTSTIEEPSSSFQDDKQWLDDICVANNIITSTGRCVTTYMCKKCGREFPHPSKIREHFRVHTGERPFKCSICSCSFAQKNSLTSHLRIHTVSRPYECRFCDVKFSTSSHRLRHEKTVHADLFRSQLMNTAYDGPPTLSPQPRLIDESNYIENEIVIEDNPTEIRGKKNASEREGQRTFVKNRAIDGSVAHLGEEYQEVVFANELPPVKGRRRRADEYKQVVVDSRIYDMAAPRPKNFSKPGLNTMKLKKPMPKGVKEDTINIVVDAIARGMDPSDILPRSKRPATIKECEYCGKKLKYPSRILEHMRTHTKEKPFVCPICHTGFAQQTTLRMHLRRHMDTRLFVCPMDGCQSSFINGALLNLHVKEVHQQKRRFACLNGCGKIFRSNSARLKHEMEMCEVVNQEIIHEHVDEQTEFVGDVEGREATVGEEGYIIEEWKEDEHGNVIYDEEQEYEDNYFYEEMEEFRLEGNFEVGGGVSAPGRFVNEESH
ncbi:unnamed protein product [Bursaphelenchus xylophilus]|uniref:(pine wood nematode) hypothetical protein n=1 Tax=Bursaphelenchus xylophilus TaxID=6326 RepID=A0A7I8XIG6_BURXY|nr:unnamed protein product [Bursaphelenchus xylophilus]CAG9085697.1 unnamed protein product [Bursaphelenchus xylophilus]